MTPDVAVVKEVLQRYSKDPTSLIMVLQDIQAALNHIPEELINTISKQLSVPRSRIYSVASFYQALSLEKRGKHRIDVCMGTACHVRGAGLLVDQLSRELRIEPDETTKDKEFTLNTVNCVGACAMGPVVVMDGEYYGQMKPARISKALKKCRFGEGAAAAAVCKYEETVKKTVKWLESADELEKVRRELIQEKPVDTQSILVCAGQQQLRNFWANVGAFHLNMWVHTMIELWAWNKSVTVICDRRQSPWDDSSRRPSHADRRSGLRREVLKRTFFETYAHDRKTQKIARQFYKLMKLAS